MQARIAVFLLAGKLAFSFDWVCAEQNFSQGRWRPCGVTMSMVRHRSSDELMIDLFQLYFRHGLNKSSYFLNRFQSEKKN